MNILHIRASNFYGGPERQLHLHCVQAIGSEFRITVGSFSENDRTPEFLTVIARDNVAIHTFAVGSAYDRKAVGLVRDYLGKNNINVLCTHDYRTHLIGWLASRKTPTKWIAFSRGWTSESLKIKAFHTLDKIIVRFADHVVAVSESQKLKLIRLFLSPDRITTVHNAVAPSIFENIPRIDLRKRFNLPDDSIIGISGGRFSAEKGQMDLVKAARIAAGENGRLVIILFGDGPDIDAVRKRIKEYDLSGRVICSGFEKEFIGCLKGADFLINPSHSEGMPNVVLEAMAMKIPCIATSVGGVGELIEDGHSGLLVPPKSPEQLAAAVLKIAGNDHLCSRYAGNAYTTAVNEYSFDSQFENLRQLYKDCRQDCDVSQVT